VVASAAADALGAPFEFGPALPPTKALAMVGGGAFGWAPGEWTDDTQQAASVLTALADDPSEGLVDAVAARLQAWFDAGPADVGNQTRGVLGRVGRDGLSMVDAAAAFQAANPNAAGNGSLMRTGPVALAALGDLPAVARLAADVSRLTHPHPDAVDACVLWSVAIARATDGPGAAPDWVDLVGAGLEVLEPDRRGLWRDRLDACRTTPPEAFTPNGWVVSALQAALASIAQTTVPVGEPPCAHLRLAIERAVRIGDDTDTVAAIAGSLLGAHWGATAVPYSWRRVLHGERTRGEAKLRLADLDRLARLAAGGGAPGAQGWPGVASLLPHYRDECGAPPLAAELVDGVVVGNVHAVSDQVNRVDAVISLCRMGTDDVPPGVEHHVIGLLDTTAADNPNLAFVLADTADLIHAVVADGGTVFVHCVQAQNRTPAVAAAYLVRHGGLAPDAALDRAQVCTGTRPQPFLADGVRGVVPA